MAFPTLSLYDNFNRANGLVYTGVLGTLWTETWIQQSGASNVSILGDELDFAGDNSCLAAQEFGPDVGVSLLINVLPEQYIFLPLRIKNGGTTSWNGYGIIWGKALGEKAQIRRYTSGSNTILGTSAEISFAKGDSIGFTAIGKKLTGWRQHEGTWSEIGSVEDSTYSEAGKVGLWGGDAIGRYDEYFASTVGSSKHEYTASVSETLSPSQSVARSTAAKRSSPETLSPSQTVTRKYEASRKPEESLTTSDFVKRAVTQARAITQTQSTSDSPGRSSVTSRTLSDTLNTSDTVKRSTSTFRAVSDTLTSSQNVSRVISALRSTVESLAASDTVEFVTSHGTKFVNETLNTSDAVTRIFHGTRIIKDALSNSDTTTRSTATKRMVSQSQSTTDSVARQTDAHRSTVDTVHGIDAVEARKIFLKNIGEILTTTDSVTKVAGGFGRNVAQSNVLSETVSRVYHGFRSVLDRVTGVDSPVARIETNYHGEEFVELSFTESEFTVIGKQQIQITAPKPESYAYETSPNMINVEIFPEDIRLDAPVDSLTVTQTYIPEVAQTSYDDKLVVNAHEA